MSKLFYDKSYNLYYCPNCTIAKWTEEIFQLKNWIKDLLDTLAGMKALEQKVADLEKELLTIRNRHSYL